MIFNFYAKLRGAFQDAMLDGCLLKFLILVIYGEICDEDKWHRLLSLLRASPKTFFSFLIDTLLYFLQFRQYPL